VGEQKGKKGLSCEDLVTKFNPCKRFQSFIYKEITKACNHIGTSTAEHIIIESMLEILEIEVTYWQ